MASSMNKMEMSLDEIIKNSKKFDAKKGQGGKGRAGGNKVASKSPTKAGVAKRKPVGKKPALKSRAGTMKRVAVKRRANVQQVAKKVPTNIATKKLVQRLVKKAVAKKIRSVNVRTPLKSTRRRFASRLGRQVGGAIVRGRVVKKNVIQRVRPAIQRIVALPQVSQQFVRAPVTYVQSAPARRRGNRGIAQQMYQPLRLSGGRNNVRNQVAVIRRQVYAPVQQPIVIQRVQQPVQRQRVVQYQRPQQQHQFIRYVQPQRSQRNQQQRGRQFQNGQRGQRRRVVKNEGLPFYDPPNFLQRI